MTKAKAWMPIYIGDYLGDTQRLTTEQHGAYLLLMFDYWRNGRLPDDDDILQQITRLDRAKWSRHRKVIERFFTVENGEWSHKRIDHEREEALSNASRRSAQAKAAADARWNADSNAPSTADGMPDAMLGECPSPSPSPSKGKPLHKKAREKFTPPCPDGVSRETWEAYLEVRRRKRSPITEKAYGLMLKAIKNSAGTPEETVSRSVMNGWTGIFAMEERDGRTGKRSAWLNA